MEEGKAGKGKRRGNKLRGVAATWLAFVFGFTLLFWLFSLPDTALLKMKHTAQQLLGPSLQT